MFAGKLLELMSSLPGAVQQQQQQHQQHQQQTNNFFGVNANGNFPLVGAHSRDESSMSANVGGVSAPLSPASSSSCSSLQDEQQQQHRNNGVQTSSTPTSSYPQSPDRIRDAFLANRLSHQVSAAHTYIHTQTHTETHTHTRTHIQTDGQADSQRAVHSSPVGKSIRRVAAVCSFVCFAGLVGGVGCSEKLRARLRGWEKTREKIYSSAGKNN